MRTIFHENTVASCNHLTSLAVGRRGIQRTRDRRHSANGIKQYATFFLLHAACLYNTAVVYRRLRQHICGPGGHHDQTSIPFDQAFVLNQCIDSTFINGKRNQSVSLEIKRNLVPCAKSDTAAIRANGALVGNFRTNKRYDAILKNIDTALVEYLSRSTGIVKLVSACKKVAVAQVQRRCDKCTDINTRIFTKNNAGLVKQEYLAVSRKRSKNLSRILVSNMVKHCCRDVGLYKLDTCILANVEAAPVGNHLLARLVHRHAGTAGANSTCACSYLPAGR